jgi:hypothetical protein
MNTNRQFIKLTSAIDNSTIVLLATSIVYVCKGRGDYEGHTEIRTWFRPDVETFCHHVTETPEQIYAMLEPYQPAALLDEYEKLANIATNVKFRLTEVLCKRIPSHIKVNTGLLADDIEIVCKEITDLADEAKRKAK